MKNDPVIIGNSMIDHYFMPQAMKQSLQHIYNIHMLSAENYKVCDPVQLSLTEQSTYKNAPVILHQDETVSYIDRTKKALSASYCTTVCGDQCK